MAGPIGGPAGSIGKLMEMPWLFAVLDPYLIWFYRLPGNAYAGFLLGTFVLSLICLVLGDITFSLAARLQGKHLDNIATEASKYQDISIDAAKAGNKSAFHAANKIANEAFGKSFFSLIALSMARLWPLPFALAWMQYRFLGVEFPIPGTKWSLGFIGVFILIYILAYLVWKRLSRLRWLLGRPAGTGNPDYAKSQVGLSSRALPVQTPMKRRGE